MTQTTCVQLKFSTLVRRKLDEVKRFEREFLALRDLRHPSVVQVYEAGMAGDYPWIAMEYVDGSDLGSLVDRWTQSASRSVCSGRANTARTV